MIAENNAELQAVEEAGDKSIADQRVETDNKASKKYVLKYNQN